MHLADAFIQSNLQCIQAIHFLSVCVFPGNIKMVVICIKMVVIPKHVMLYFYSTS